MSATSSLSRLSPETSDTRYLPEAPQDAPAIERVLERAFGPGRFAKPAERVREFARHDLALSRCVWREETLLGCCRIYHIALNGEAALFLGPLAIDPTAQHHGLGHTLVRETLAACAAGGGRAVILMGQPSFFGDLGFSRVPEGRVLMPAPAEARRLQWIALAAGGLDTLAGPIAAPRV